MKIKNLIKVLFTVIVTISITSCDITNYDEDVIQELSVSREFAPIELTARVRNQTTVELNWIPREEINTYAVEFSADDPNFTTIFKSVEVSVEELPVQIKLEGLTEYSIRVKAISANGLEDSKWALATVTTLSEQLMLPSVNGDVAYNDALFRWEAGINVTKLVLQPGDITHTISEAEKSVGIATVTGLNSLTDYEVTLFNNDKPRGFSSIKTEVDPATGTVVKTSDDLLTMILNASFGETLILEPGDYTTQIGTANLDKSIIVRGLLSYDKPKININFQINNGATDVSFMNIEFDGKATVQDVVRYTGAGNYNSLLVSDCIVHDYDRSFIAGNTTDAIIQNVTVEKSIVTDVVTNGGDFIDFRNSDVLNLNVNTSTFNNCAPARDFIRMDDAGTLASQDPANISNVIIESCTLYACSNKNSKRLLYVRFEDNEIEVHNTLITDTEVEGYSDQSRTDEDIIFSNNNYFNAPTLIDDTVARYDASGTHTELDPGFVNPLIGDFTVTNQTLKDNLVGDPRWLK
ncbi:hypothetical protein BW723_03460 [Polaribacter reichenbachii]|uniref:Fibronectin type-III domain-containing protein n=1 Tax=Polaribacter reichenbachii TaxID=996801 RepID=A0A1B8TVD3_9FLAO|nr:DUF5123 domain-containing protein [Polaribacter reichenbachii]APZ45417.1 hypothetical protein BW723_03460 [Polaribacter reichenbachii]AUC19278.1 hypothetical protein BTO17_11465 [Polaribacter reichenbachii]OBY63567.1 hypothetical protein LPB301_12240 [Polaribacter reichenbachii]